MKVLVTLDTSDRSETELVCSLAKEGLDAGVICAPGAACGDRFRAAGLPVTELAFRNRLDRRAIRAARVVLRDGGYTCVHSLRNSDLSCMLLAARGLPVKHVAYRGTAGHLGWWDPASRLTYLNPRVDRIVCVSEAVRQYLLSLGLAAEKLVTIHKGHDVGWYRGLAGPSPVELGVPAGACTVVFTGNVRPVKGVDVLLDAMERLPADANVHLVLVGEARDRRVRRLAKRAAAQERVHTTGFREDAAAIAGKGDIFVMPSVEREGLPRAVIEAMAQNVPPVVSATGGMPELVVDGVSGLVVPPRDADALAGAILKLARDAGLRKRLGTQAGQRIRESFTIEETVRKTLALYASLQGAGHSIGPSSE